MTDNTIIDNFYRENVALIEYLQANGEPSFQSNADNQLKKVLVLSIASYFEHCISDLLLAYVNHHTSKNERLISFMKRKGIDRQYHTYFKWDGNNANQFYALFGDTFKRDAEKAVKAEATLQTAIQSFLTLGNLRNEMVHENFASFYLDMTFAEVYGLYNSSLPFLSFISKEFALPTTTTPADEQIVMNIVENQPCEPPNESVS
jgi:hypothetical protein